MSKNVFSLYVAVFLIFHPVILRLASYSRRGATMGRKKIQISRITDERNRQVITNDPVDQDRRSSTIWR